MSLLEDAYRRQEPLFLNERLHKWSDIFSREVESFFYIEKREKSNHYLDLSRVIGTNHPDYAGLTWLEVLESGKRMSSYLREAELDETYYFKDNKKDGIFYATCDEMNYFIIDGNHRTAIARLIFSLRNEQPILRGITIHSYSVDHQAYGLYLRFSSLIREKNLSLQLITERKHLKDIEESGWHKKIYYCYFILMNSKTGETQEMEQAQLSDTLLFINSASWFSRKVRVPNKFRILREVL